MSETQTPPNYFRDRVTAERTDDPIDEIKKLNSAGRLAIHVWEEGREGTIPHGLIQQLRIPEEKIAQNLAAHRPPMISLTLLPSPSTKNYSVGVMPFEAGLTNACRPSYLVDVSQDRDDRVIIPRIHEDSMNSGSDPYDKNLQLGKPSRIPVIEGARRARPQRSQAIAYAAGPDGAALAEAQMDSLNARMHQLCVPGTSKVHNCNEMLAVVGEQHIKAIVVPFAAHGSSEYQRVFGANYAKLTAAVAGLQHLAMGIELPAVIYHVWECPPKKGGEFTFVGDDRASLRAAALEALEGLDGYGQGTFDPSKSLLPLGDALKETLGIDIRQPLRAQLLKIQADTARAPGQGWSGRNE